MSFRTVIVKNRCKLEYSLNYLVCRNQNSEKRILVDEISTIIIQSTGVSLTTALLSALAERNIKVILCDAQANPQSELIAYNGGYDSYEKLMIQFSLVKNSGDLIWKRIVEEKINNQCLNLAHYSKESSDKLDEYKREVQIGDQTNREGHAAKVYFNSLFGTGFSRDRDCFENKCLDYGYTIILSCFNRTIKALGYYPELGIHHIGKTNPFNLSCDLMEPFRPIIDKKVKEGCVDDNNFKTVMIEILEENVKICGNEMFLENAVKIYVQSIFNALDKCDPALINFIEYEF